MKSRDELYLLCKLKYFLSSITTHLRLPIDFICNCAISKTCFAICPNTPAQWWTKHFEKKILNSLALYCTHAVNFKKLYLHVIQFIRLFYLQRTSTTKLSILHSELNRWDHQALRPRPAAECPGLACGRWAEWTRLKEALVQRCHPGTWY